jgi:carbohydrate kinase (thermoresistant glucokinase family)
MTAADDDGAILPLVLIVMGVSGSGKSTIAEAINTHLHWPFQEGDALHPPSNVQKMHAGIPLTDEDRAPWLQAIKTWIDARVAASEPGLVTCSALRRTYRDTLVCGRSQVHLLYLKADPAVLQARLAQRTGHFMPASLLQSQLATLEEPGPDERPIVVRVDDTVEETVADTLAALPKAR